ncbi:MAG: hypothetical protein JO354_04665 [Verrucomicrobia bacterium]|nr:hypothetical protein [Verrucomicrobiota bacterium]
MNDIENELRKLRPTRPSNGLPIRIGMALADAGKLRDDVITPHRFRVNWVGLGLGVAAAAAFLIVARLDVHPPAATRHPVASNSTAPPRDRASEVSSYQAIGLTQVVYSKRNEGLLFPPGSATPVRRLRTTRHETMRWEDPHTGARLQVSYPAEEVTLIPVSGQ